MAQALVSLPPRYARGEIITVRALVQHPMETGYRRGADGALLPRDLVRRFTCRFVEGQRRIEVFSAELHAAIAANPLLAFPFRVIAAGRLECEWSGDNGFRHLESVTLTPSA